jgi:hypothetical protein
VVASDIAASLSVAAAVSYDGSRPQGKIFGAMVESVERCDAASSEFDDRA